MITIAEWFAWLTSGAATSGICLAIWNFVHAKPEPLKIRTDFELAPADLEAWAAELHALNGQHRAHVIAEGRTRHRRTRYHQGSGVWELPGIEPYHRYRAGAGHRAD